MGTRVIVWLMMVAIFSVIGFFASILGPITWLIAPFYGYSFRKDGGWAATFTMVLGLFLGGSLLWLMTGIHIWPLIAVPVINIFLFLSGALASQIKDFIGSKRNGSRPSDPPAGGNKLFHRLFPKQRQADQDQHRLRVSAMPIV